MSPKNRQQYGSTLQHEPDFNGPRGKRSCTDVLCLLLFITALVAWGFVGRYAYVHGDPNRLIVPADSNGRRCGQDSEVFDKKNLLFFDLTKCATSNVFLDGCTTPQICVKKCPEKAWSAYYYLKNPDKFDVADVTNNLICKTDISHTVTDVNILKSVIGRGICAPWQIASIPVYGRCLPTIDQIRNADDVIKLINSTFDDVKHATEIIQKLSTVNEIGERVIEDIMHTWQYLVIGLGIAMFICLIYITMLRWLAGLMIWLSLVAIMILLGLAVFVCFGKYNYYRNLPIEETDLAPMRMTLRTRLNNFFVKPSTWLGLLIGSCVLLIIVVLVLVFLRQRINIAITLIKEGSKAVGSVISALFFPVFPWIFMLGVVVYFAGTGVYLASIGHNVFKVYGLKNNPNCICSDDFYKDRDYCTVNDFKTHCSNPNGGDCLNAGCNFVSLESDNIITYLQLYNLFVMFWGVYFLSGLAQMILAATFASWYWTFHKRHLPFFTLTGSVYRSIRYHLGTVAFGSLIIAICSFIRTIIEFIELKLKKYSDNVISRAIFCLLRCCFWCLHKFICFINTNAYIMCAIHGKNFCTSAQEAFFLLMRNVVRVVVVDKVTDFLFFLGKIVITATVMVGAYFVFKGPVRLLNNSGIDVYLNYSLVPVVALGIGTYLIASIFFGVYAMAVDTLFLCFLEDCERNDGSPEKPYFMSKKLMKILGKKNKM